MFKMNQLIHIQSLKKSFSSRVLFQDLTFTVHAKERLALLGPNGSGKSTLLKILVGLETLDAGTITTKKGLRIGYVPQSSEFGNQSPLEILIEAQGGSIRNDVEKRHAALLWLSKLGFKGDEISADRLSGGWKKRLAFAMAVINSPDLLLLDEPTNHLDLDGVIAFE